MTLVSDDFETMERRESWKMAIAVDASALEVRM
jgi:hypothetical protein